MIDRIHLLPDSVANQIAAGEVIQRPSSVIKELVENAVDAGADDIKIIIRDGGRTLIQVVDNGMGMSETDVRMAFERHATSKIRCADDLSSLTTMGFRGEALPSISAVSMVEVRTRTQDAPIGTKLIIEGSREISQEPDMCDKGTNIMVKNLFFNVPARRKFMKSDSVELANIYKEFERLALVNPGVRMSIDTGSKTVDLRKATFKQRISNLWKGNIESQIIPVEADTSVVKISGFVSRPEFARRRNALQFLLVNGRNMRHPYFSKAIMNCYNSLISPETKPSFFLKFEVDPASIDVNIHPTKDEIKFEDESVIWTILSAAVKASLGKYSSVPTIDFDVESVPVSPLPKGEMPEKPDMGFSLSYNPFEIESAGRNAGRDEKARREKTSVKNWDELYEGFLRGKGDGHPSSIRSNGPSGESINLLPGMEEAVSSESICMQYADKYIFTSTRRGLIVIDQYRAHVKILYEKLLSRSASEVSLTQSLVFPELFDIDDSLSLTLEEMNPYLKRLGIDIEQESDGNYYLKGVPAMLESPEDPLEMTRRVLENLQVEVDGEIEEERMLHRAALAMARNMAVKKGRVLSSDEMEQLIAELFKLPDPSLAPNGRRIFAILDEEAIGRLLP